MNIAQLATQRHTTKAFDASRTLSVEHMAQIRSLLRYSASSVNSQPWHFLIAGSHEAKARVAKSTEVDFAYNTPKILNASHVVVFCARNDMDETHLHALLAQEQQDGRFANDAAREGQDKGRRFYTDLNRNGPKGLNTWMEKQVYLAMGTLLLGAQALSVNACPMEGFDSARLDEEFDLASLGLHSVALVALGYRSEDDFNGKLPKSRLPEAAVITSL
ncbi:oxygen-insensitive NAD(P)H nitroreductase [Hydrogenophaga luteola]|uniref:Oxygen-insensitive NAD(P)H nitroreductase n=1 Tax=Hydrogenophaga luteola TaxID=1591122 RepID=A0ABV7VZR6_9BURK